MLYPLKFTPIFKQRLWGGRRLAELFDKPLPPGVPVGESWELSGLPNDESVVANGPLAGAKLTELVARFGADLLGHAALIDGQFPLLVKLLDARRPLSVQVHPGVAMVSRPGSAARLKNECWHVLDAEPGAKVWVGLNEGVDRPRFAAAVADGTVEQLLHVEPAKAGHTFYLPAGTVHALGAGLVVAEVQTPSDTTYRAFDWNRVDEQTGRPRQLHVAEAIEAIDYSPRPPQPAPSHRADVFSTVSRLVACENFVVEKVRFSEGVERGLPYAEMVVWLVLTGRGQVHCGGGAAVPFKAGELLLLPAALEAGRVVCRSDCVWLEVTVPAVGSMRL